MDRQGGKPERVSIEACGNDRMLKPVALEEYKLSFYHAYVLVENRFKEIDSDTLYIEQTMK